MLFFWHTDNNSKITNCDFCFSSSRSGGETEHLMEGLSFGDDHTAATAVSVSNEPSFLVK